MVARRMFVVSLLFILTQGGFGIKRIIKQKWERDVEKSENRYENQRHFGEHRMGKFPTVCPPSPGEVIFEWQTSKWDEHKAKLRAHPLAYLRYVCGFTQIMKKTSTEESADNSITIMHNVPLCCPGYIRNEDDICVPKCNGGCKHGVCLAPDNCVCYEGYTMNKLGHCVQTCPCGCPHGQCHEETCICDAGYTLDLETQTCTPACQSACVNGDCTEPNVCSCHPGFMKSNQSNICIPQCNGCQNDCKRSDDGTCVPVCEGCEHGDCVETGNCVCHEGYARRNQSCVPVCTRRCINGFCAAPNQCECNRGYVKVTPYRCAYGCNSKCYNADCVGLNQCECHEGFYKRDPVRSPNMCYPIIIGILEAASNNVNDFNNGINIYS